jgi:hypothetical protein
MTLLHHKFISQIKLHGFWKRSALTNMKKDALKYMINRLWYEKWHIIIYKYDIWIQICTIYEDFCFSVDFFHIPGAISFPHFYLAADRYKNSVGGLNPSEEEHQTYLDLEHVCKQMVAIGHFLSTSTLYIIFVSFGYWT